MANKKLNKSLWALADDLRGSTSMDILELRNYVLGIMFFKFISDKNEKFYKEETGISDLDIFFKDADNATAVMDEAKAELGFAFKYNDLYSTIVKCIKNGTYSNELLASAILNFNDSIESLDDFSNLFDDIRLDDNRLGISQKQKDEVISRIIIKIQDIESEVGKFNSDMLGDAYEYLISMFASNSGKKAGEFYTPQAVSKLLSKVVTSGDNEIKDIYDPTAGSGSLLLRIASDIKKEGKKYRTINGQELITTTYNLARMNMIIHGVNFKDFSIKQGDTILDDKFRGKKFDVIVSNPPYGTKWGSPSELLQDDRFYKYGNIAPKGAMEMSFVQHIDHHLNDNGKAAILLPVGVLFRAGAENKILARIIEDGILESVVLLPPKMFVSTPIPVIMMVLNKAKKNKNVFMIDASDLFVKEGKNNTLTDENVEQITQLLYSKEDTRISKELSYETIKENKFNLNVTRYIQRVVEEEIDINSLGVEIKDNLIKLRELETSILNDIDKIKELI